MKAIWVLSYNTWLLGTVWLIGKAIIDFIQNERKLWFVAGLAAAPFWPFMLAYNATRKVLAKQINEG